MYLTLDMNETQPDLFDSVTVHRETSLPERLLNFPLIRLIAALWLTLNIEEVFKELEEIKEN